MINLKNVTLFQFNCLDPEIGVKAIQYSKRGINFGRTVLVTHRIPENITSDIEVFLVDKTDHDGSSKFHFGPLQQYCSTDYLLSIQTDGFVINPHLWTDEFLEYDYIGAPWPFGQPWHTTYRVGNGGFRLESKRLIELCSNIPWNPGDHDDMLIGVHYRPYLESQGCKFPTVEFAAKFSLELVIPEIPYNLNNCFGYHGKHTDQSRAYSEMIKHYEQ